MSFKDLNKAQKLVLDCIPVLSEFISKDQKNWSFFSIEIVRYTTQEYSVTIFIGTGDPCKPSIRLGDVENVPTPKELEEELNKERRKKILELETQLEYIKGGESNDRPNAGNSKAEGTVPKEL